MAKPATFSNPVRGTMKPATSAGFSFQKDFRPQIRAKFKQKLNERMAIEVPYKLAQLCSSNPKDWYVFFYYMDPASNKYKRFKERHGLNNFKQLATRAAQYNRTADTCRQIMADEMIKVINEELKKGFNPLQQNLQNLALQNDLLLPTVQAVVDRLVSAATDNTKETYRLMFGRFKKYLLHLGIDHWPIGLFKIEHAEEFQSYLQASMQLSKKTVNATISHVGLFWDELPKPLRANGNPFRQVKPLKDKDYKGLAAENEEDVFEPLTSAELDAILKELKARGEVNFICFLAFIYYAWARPVEITRLKISAIDLTNGVINFNKSGTKNKKAGIVQIVPELKKLIKKMQLEKIKQFDWYIFSTDFKPGPKMIDASRGVGYLKWNPIIEKLGINKKMYALKHSGNIEYLLQNKGAANLKWQQMQNRHASASMTEQYCRKLGAYFIDVGKVKFRSF